MENGVSLGLWEKLAQISPDMLCILEEGGFFTNVSQASGQMLGYSPDELVGCRYTDFIHPDSLAVTQEAIGQLLGGLKASNFENCYIHRDGRRVQLAWTAAWSAEDRVFVCVARDITEVQRSRQQLEESEQRYRALFDNSPDIILVQNKQGLITDVNQAFVHLAGVRKEALVGQPVASVMPPEVASVSEQHLQQALRGNLMRYDLKFEKEGKPILLDAQKFPIVIGGEIVGVQTIARDITPLVQSYEKIQRQSERLNTVFESITDAFVMLDRDWRLTHINSEAERLVGFDKQQHLGISLWEVFPEQEGGAFHARYTEAFDTGRAVHFTSYLQEHKVWLQVKACPSPEGMSVYFDDVTAMVESRQRLEMLSIVASKTQSSVIILDKDRQVEWVNEAFTKRTGYSLAELAGVRPFSLLVGEDTDKAAISRIVGQATSGHPVGEQILLYTKSGEKRWFKMEATPVFDENGSLYRMIGIMHDITERVKTRRELERLSLVASRTNNGVVIADRNYRIEWVNDGFTRLSGYTLDEARGKVPSHLLQSESTDTTVLATVEERLKAGEQISIKTLDKKKNGETVWMAVEATGLFEQGQLTGFLEVLTDVTALENSKLELSKLALDLYRHNSDLQQFTYIVSHNLRAPVANAMGLARILAKTDKATAGFDKTLSYLSQSVLQLDSLLHDMNTILSIREGKAEPEGGEVELLPVVEEAVSFYQEQLAACGANLRIDISQGVRVQANKAYLYSVFHNLLSNALKYRSGERGLEVRIRYVGDSARGALVSFSDNGVGFDLQRARGDVFKPYKRFHSDRRGRGIGLYLVRAHLESMGGHVEVTSAVGKGTKFLIYLTKKATA